MIRIKKNALGRGYRGVERINSTTKIVAFLYHWNRLLNSHEREEQRQKTGSKIVRRGISGIRVLCISSANNNNMPSHWRNSISIVFFFFFFLASVRSNVVNKKMCARLRQLSWLCYLLITFFSLRTLFVHLRQRRRRRRRLLLCFLGFQTYTSFQYIVTPSHVVFVY